MVEYKSISQKKQNLVFLDMSKIGFGPIKIYMLADNDGLVNVSKYISQNGVGHKMFLYSLKLIKQHLKTLDNEVKTLIIDRSSSIFDDCLIYILYHNHTNNREIPRMTKNDLANAGIKIQIKRP